jgi:hypothetical protein
MFRVINFGCLAAVFTVFVNSPSSLKSRIKTPGLYYGILAYAKLANLLCAVKKKMHNFAFFKHIYGINYSSCYSSLQSQKLGLTS